MDATVAMLDGQSRRSQSGMGNARMIAVAFRNRCLRPHHLR